MGNKSEKEKEKAGTSQHHERNSLRVCEENNESSHTECTSSRKIVQIETYTKRNKQMSFYSDF